MSNANYMEDLITTVNDLTNRFPEGFPADRNGIRLGIAAIEDETQEVWEEWRQLRRSLPDCDMTYLRTELLQVAAVCLMIVRSIDA